MFSLGMQELIIILIILGIPALVAAVVILIMRRGRNKSVKREDFMYCTKCGKQNDDNAFKCVQCGNMLQRSAAPEVIDIPNYLVQAILVTIFCCLPFGIPAIVFAAQVNGKIAAGDYDGAVATSKKAKLWSWVSFWVGLGFVVIYVFLAIVGAVAGRRY